MHRDKIIAIKHVHKQAIQAFERNAPTIQAVTFNYWLCTSDTSLGIV